MPAMGLLYRTMKRSFAVSVTFTKYLDDQKVPDVVQQREIS